MYSYTVILCYSYKSASHFVSFVNSFDMRAVYKTLFPELIVEISGPTRDSILLIAGWLALQSS